ncbi:putative dihydroxyacetone kinase (DakA) [Aspergillus stella-maris]|uniref:putative dihydroxyacetone kinase (DakA) n=1 Tax=Aspergillus stella-maris TaxID=1810926 RepID=UPI003CCDE46C
MSEPKHFFTDPTHLVHTALNSLTLTNPSLALDLENKIVFRRPDTVKKGKVAIVTGGGSGHEPAFGGYVGKGFCDAAVAGTIFASPSAEQIRIGALERVNHENGVLIIPNNYTGDVLNFGMAAEKSRAAGVQTEFYAMADDVGVGKKKSGKVGRRGIGGGIFILKVVGALAEAGGTLEEVYNLAQFANANIVSVGSSLEHVHVPGREPSKDFVEHGEVEIGMGIHNEPGSHRAKTDLKGMVETMLLQMLDHNDPDRAYVTRKPEDTFALLINNLGGVSTLELSGITDEVHRQLNDTYKIKSERVIQGTFLTSLNGLGFSISLLKLADTGLGPGKSFLELLDAPAEAVGWAAPITPSTWEHRNSPPVELKKVVHLEQPPSNIKLDIATVRKVLGAGLQRMIEVEPQVTRYDTIVGDGDCGIGLKRGAEAVLKLLNDSSADLNSDVVHTVNKIVTVVENTMDGTSGAIYAIFLNALLHGLREQDKGSEAPANVEIWGNALKYSITALGKYTPAQPGDRTMIDALVPFSQTLSDKKDVHAAAKAAEEATEATKHMKASLGRTVYVGGEEEWVGKIPDPGAYGLSEFFNGLASAL